MSNDRAIAFPLANGTVVPIPLARLRAVIGEETFDKAVAEIAIGMLEEGILDLDGSATL